MTSDEIAFLFLLGRYDTGDGSPAPQAVIPPSSRSVDKARQGCRRLGLVEFSTYSRPAGWRLTEAGRDVLVGLRESLTPTHVATHSTIPAHGQISGHSARSGGGGWVRSQTTEEGR